MGYSMSLSLTKEAPIDEITTIFKNSIFLKNNESIYISNEAREHGYSVAHENGLYISFSSVTQPESYFIHGFFKIVASLYGEKIVNPKDNQLYPFYNYDGEYTIIISHAEHITNKANYKDFATYKDQVVDDDYIEDLNELLEQKADEARENGEEYKDDITQDIKYFSFESISFDLPKPEFPLFNILHDFLIDESRSMKEILNYLKTLEVKLTEIKKT
jgi:hypothetical protein